MTEITITLRWRDENYGRIYQAVAFRDDVFIAQDLLPDMVYDLVNAKIASIYAQHGFQFNYDRCSWICEGAPPDTRSNLIEALADEGFSVKDPGYDHRFHPPRSHDREP